MKKCESCGKEFKPWRSTSRFCSRRCLWDDNSKREPHNKGKGKGWTDKRGYRWVYVVENGKPRQKREHRYVMELHLGRKLSPEELVHHKNEDKTDNRIENLEVKDWSEHTKDHHYGGQRTDQQKKTMEVISRYREENKDLKDIRNELFEALEDLVEHFDGLPVGDGYERARKARAALAKATGQDQ